MKHGVLIAGGGLAAQRCCQTLRSGGFEGPIRVICEEDRLPYDRPPLSKDVLSGDRDPGKLAFRPGEWYREHGIDLLLGERAVALDPGIRTITLASGGVLSYDAALVATGSRPRKLPGTESFANAHTLRTVEDALRLRAALRAGDRLIVVGAGFIGLEVAATARRLALEVTVLEAAPAPLLRVLPPELAAWFVELHRSEGVEVLLSAHVARFGEGPLGAEWVQLTDGRRLECDALVIGIGIEPATEWLEGSGLDPAGVKVDGSGRSEAPDVFAAGDSARPLDPVWNEHTRSEHWEAAARQALQVGRAILGVELAPPVLASFWTDQYGLRVQLVGDPRGSDRIEFDGNPESRDFNALLFRGERPVAGFAVAQPRSLAALRRRIDEGSEAQTERKVHVQGTSG